MPATRRPHARRIQFRDLISCRRRSKTRRLLAVRVCPARDVLPDSPPPSPSRCFLYRESRGFSRRRAVNADRLWVVHSGIDSRRLCVSGVEQAKDAPKKPGPCSPSRAGTSLFVFRLTHSGRLDHTHARAVHVCPSRHWAFAPSDICPHPQLGLGLRLDLL